MAFAAIVAVVGVFFTILPGEYEPKEDRNSIFLKISAREGAGYYVMRDYAQKILKKIKGVLDEGIAKNITTTVGRRRLPITRIVAEIAYLGYLSILRITYNAIEPRSIPI